MSLEKAYGTQPDHLPRSMIRLSIDRSSGRRYWKGSSGVDILDSDSYVLLAEESIRRFPWKRDLSIDWDRIPEGMSVWSDCREEVSLIDFAHRVFSNPGDLIFFWVSISVPSVRIKSKDVPIFFDEIEECFSSFWVYSVADSVLVEKSFSGGMSASPVPPPGLFEKNLF